MNSRNHYNGISAYAVKLIRFKAHQLSRLSFFGSDDVEDLEQELVMDLIQRMPDYDPDRASQNTFMARVIENCAASLVATAKAPIRNGGRPGLSWEELIDSSNADAVEALVDTSLPTSTDGSDLMVAMLDLNRCLQRLSSEQKRFCQLLPFQEPSAISREMGWSRATFFRRLANLRETFRQSGLESFFATA
ncbi:MAG: sigma-70 family RNA polymerase sigma factor [Magnetococcales bacterium]|nr:sigma-70 family RNA polymerase sigma factor [Magnetococcales bacterium]